MKILKIVLLLIVSFLMVGCSILPTYYSKSEVKRYVRDVFGTEYKYKKSKTKVDDTEEKNKLYQYIFENKEGHAFSVYSGTCHATIDSSKTIFYSKNLYTDYVYTKIQSKLNDIESTFNKYNISYDYDGGELFKLYLENVSEIKQAAKLIAELDEIIGLNYDESRGKIKSNNLISSSVSVYIKPDLVQVSKDWKNDYSYIISFVYLSANRDKPLKAEEIEKEVIHDLVENELHSPQNEYNIPDNIMEEYRADKVSFEITDNKYIDFYYDKEAEEYYTILGLCKRYEVYSYERCENFRYLVEYLGGSFYKEDLNASWTIGANTWDAEMIVDSKKEYEDIIIKLNDEKLILSDYNSKIEKKFFRNCYTINDLEKMLNAEITIKQNPAKVEIKSK